MGKPKAHLFYEGGGMVTGTHDAKEARRLLADEWLETMGDREERQDIAFASRQFRLRDARLQTGRIIPADPGDDVRWWWRSGYKLGKPGVTRAVVWHG